MAGKPIPIPDQVDPSSIVRKRNPFPSVTQTVELDWLLEIKGPAQITRRQAAVKCRLERRKKQWKIVAIDPVDLFAPPVPK